MSPCVPCYDVRMSNLHRIVWYALHRDVYACGWILYRVSRPPHHPARFEAPDEGREIEAGAPLAKRWWE